MEEEITKYEPEDSQYADYEEISDTQDDTQQEYNLATLKETVSDAVQTLSMGADVAQNVASLYSSCLQMHERTKQIEAVTQVKLAQTIAKFKTCQDVITKTFAERDKGLQKFYDMMDKGVETGDRDLILAAMNNISNIVTTSPLADFQAFCKRCDDPDDPLIDF